MKITPSTLKTKASEELEKQIEKELEETQEERSVSSLLHTRKSERKDNEDS